jgi:hypothetical protein
MEQAATARLVFASKEIEQLADVLVSTHCPET